VSASKSRAVSGLSKEQVEAPKNYVDFDEEQEKLKGLVNDKSHKEKGVMEGLVAQFERAPAPKMIVQHPPGAKDHAWRPSADLPSPSIESTYLSTAPLSPTSSPSSPVFGPIMQSDSSTSKRNKLVLHSRILLQRYGEGHGVNDAKILKNGELVLVLQKSGYVAIICCYAAAKSKPTGSSHFFCLWKGHV
jgi:hypothetical protein